MESSLLKIDKQPSEFEVQSYLYQELNDMGIKTRGEVITKDGRCRFDLVSFWPSGQVRGIIEVKKQKCNPGISKQVGKYKEYAEKIVIIGGMKKAETFIKKIKTNGNSKKFQLNLDVKNVTPKKREKIKITKAGQPCRKCGEPVEKVIPVRKVNPKSPYYFKYYLRCPACRVMYMLESQKVYNSPRGLNERL